MAALSTFAELMARASATVFSQLCSNALEKAAQQQSVGQPLPGSMPFPLLPPLIALSTPTIVHPPPIPPQTSPPQTVFEQHKSPAKSLKAAADAATKTPPSTVSSSARKRKRPRPSSSTEDNRDCGSLAAPTDRQPSSSPLSGSRISSPDSASAAHKARKLKLYAAEEKTDIIDYAKCIGNRAAGREFNVAESSIREWRKNEEKIRKQAESTAGCTQHFEKERPDILGQIDDELVRLINSGGNGKDKERECSSWYGIAAKARAFWAEKARDNDIDAGEMKVTMGWVARFMRRNEHRVPKIAPPIIATGNAAVAAGSPSSPSMVKRNTILDAATPSEPRGTRARLRPREPQAAVAVAAKEKSPISNETQQQQKGNGSSRRKAARPMRVDTTCATLLTTSARAELAENGDGGS